MRPEDVYALKGISDPRISPSGDRIAFTQWRVSKDDNSYPSAIWVTADDGGPRQLTEGAKTDSQARWSPDGSQLAFVSNRDSDKAQLYVIPVDGGEGRRLTDLKETVTEVAWSPDGSKIAFACRDPAEHYDIEEDKDRPPRHLTRLRYKLDDVGWTADRPQHVYVVPADGSTQPVMLTKGEFEDSAPSWSADGTRIAFASARHDDWDIELVQSIYVVDADGGQPVVVTSTDGWCELPSWSPDNKHIAYSLTHGTRAMDMPRHGQVAEVDLESGESRVLTASLDRNCAPFPQIREPVWDGADILFAIEDAGNTHVYRVPADGSRVPELVIGGDANVTGYDAHGGRVVHTAVTSTTLPELYEGSRRVTNVGEDFSESVGIHDAQRFTARSADGTEVDAWIIRPRNFDEGTRYPVLLNIHGGPFTQYGNRFFDEFQVYAAAGYVVVYANPRGSSGYGEAEARAIRGPVEGGPGWGTVDYEDLMAVVDAALERFDFCDPDRLGVMGGSYGGYMTSWIVSHTKRFKAACSERAVNNWYSMHGSSDLGWVFRGYFGAFAFDAPEAYMKHSPISYAHQIETPLLILHSENDLRCPIEQAEQLFTTLRLLQRDVEFVRFPAESHELTRSGSPRHRVARFEIILDWFERKLK